MIGLHIVFAITVLILYSAFLMVYIPQASYRSGMLFAVKLPPDAMGHPEIKSVQDRFRKETRQVSLWTAAALLPYVLLFPWMGFQVVYFMAWMAGFTIVMVRPFQEAFRRTLELKRREDWFVGPRKRVMQVDLRAARRKNERSLSPWLFLIPLSLGAGLILVAGLELIPGSRDSALLPLASMGLILTLVMLGLALMFRRMKAEVYSADSEVNLLLNQARRRSLSWMWLLLAILENGHVLLLLLAFSGSNEGLQTVWFYSSLAFALVPTLLIYRTFRSIRKLEEDVLTSDGGAVYSDDDEYWANGFTYHNPQDSRIMVPKRFGIGATFNTATPVGKSLYWGALGLAGAVMLSVCALMLISEFVSPSMEIAEQRRVHISYPMYSMSFNVVDVQELTLVDGIPSGSKRSGEATDKVLRGSFSLDGLGKSNLYVYKNNPPYIRVKLKERFVFFNERDRVSTEELFRQLQSVVVNQK
ncbi:DUF5808 domain-containing protein [Paenibacillus herberti]|uniref:DUF5808 domain-containing protein n=1 Tax=Paenibacillus herberti TaxID=1619309 RepID=A0A229NY41_9BACL|nr:DUF5808 domain-containing protein [Paenibacillus herberti]OXM14790.1 hypothetical protein CGZ75_18130 [Paenibacillus herberti]